MSTDISTHSRAARRGGHLADRGTDWRGAFVIGLAGVILVTGITPFAVQAMGAAAIPASSGSR